MDTKNTKSYSFPYFFLALRVVPFEVHNNQNTGTSAYAELFDHNVQMFPYKNTKATSNNSSEYFSYKDTITNTSVNPPQSYEIIGVAKKTKVGNKTIIDFNGSGYKTVTITDSEGKKIETTYKVYSKMQGEMCKNGNIKIILDEENGETSKAKIDGQEVVFNDLYASESNFCLKKVK